MKVEGAGLSIQDAASHVPSLRFGVGVGGGDSPPSPSPRKKTVTTSAGITDDESSTSRSIKCVGARFGRSGKFLGLLGNFSGFA